MDRSKIQELHFITPLSNLGSIVKEGILSNERAARLATAPDSIALAEVQERRDQKEVPGGMRLHRYANLYLNARNPMLYKRLNLHASIGVVSVSKRVLELPNVVVSDGNAASSGTRFGDVQSEFEIVDKELTFARFWTHSDPYDYLNHKRAMCAEVLVPDSVPPEYIRGVYVSCDEVKQSCDALGLPLKFKVNGYLFFRGEPG